MGSLLPLWGERLQAARIAAGYTQAGLAEAVGVTQQAISNWEKGKGSPKDKHRVLLARILHVTAQHLFPYDEVNGEAA